MTVIAANPYMIAGDRRIQDSSDLNTTLTIPKIAQGANCLIGVAGEAGVCLDILHDDITIKPGGYKEIRVFVKSLHKRLCKDYEDPEYDLLIVYDQSVWSFSAGVLLQHEYYAIGSGGHIALGAMAHGASPAEACEYAIQFIGSCGGPVDAIKC